MRIKLFPLLGIGFIAVVAIAIASCDSTAPSSTSKTEPTASNKTNDANSSVVGDEAHAHKAGAHGGILVSLGRDSYHAEAVFEKNGTVRLYMLGKDEARIQEVEAQELAAYVSTIGSPDSVKVAFRAEPQSGDAKGKTSLFLATLPQSLLGKRVQVTLNNININGERFRIAFSNESTDRHADSEMPAKLVDTEERKLFLTPGGLYTAADIQANGNTVPTVKYKGIRAQHDDNPKVGEKICPISKTKANPKFTWVVGGKVYEFCCIPCIEEFVVLAKEKSEEIKDPSEYLKK